MSEPHGQLRTQRDGNDLLVFIKAVPNASRDAIAGIVGDRLKVRIAAPPEGGKANAAICALLAQRLGLKSREVAIESGHTSAEKTVRILNGDETAIAQLISS